MRTVTSANPVLAPRTGPAPGPLSPVERAALRAACDAFFPALVPEGGDDAALFALDARAVGVAEAVESALGTLRAEPLGELSALLRLLERPASMLALAKRARPFHALSALERGRVLRRMAMSPIPKLRTGYQALKRLSSFLAYAGLDEARRNPTWPRIGYVPSADPPACAPALRITPIAAPTVLECDACVIGSGAGGGVVAAALAAAGRAVVVLEAGPGDQAPDFDQREATGFARLYLEGGLSASRDLAVAVFAGACTGGGTSVNWQTCLRTPDDVRAEWAERSGCEALAGAAFDAALDQVSARIGAGTDESVMNANNAPIERGCAALGWSCTTLPRNARGCDPAQCGHCTFGCRAGGKQSTAVTFLADAQRQADARIVAGCRARRVTIEHGRATGVEAVTVDGHAVTVRARCVVVAAGSIGSPALLLRSGLTLPAIGRNLYLHPTAGIAARYPEPVRSWEGPPQTRMSGEFAHAFGGYGFRLESAPAHPGLMALALPWFDARSHRRAMQDAARTSTLIALTRDRRGGRVTIDREGRPVIRYRPGRQERELLRRGIVAAARVHVAAGAERVVALHESDRGFDVAGKTAAELERCLERVGRAAVDRNRAPVFSAHQMGSCRMGRDPASAVCDETGNVFGVRGLYVADASAFPASSGVNPMLTVLALAHLLAGRIVAQTSS